MLWIILTLAYYFGGTREPPEGRACQAEPTWRSSVFLLFANLSILRRAAARYD